ncbi:MAG: hypothetical protein AAGI48_08815 [Verrucomicrobiota bacterium]
MQLKESRIASFADHLGEASPDIELLRYDDCWRPLISPEADASLDGPGTLSWDDRWGGPLPYGHPRVGHIKPLDFDAWGDPNTHIEILPMDFRGELKVEEVEFAGVRGHRFRITLNDLRGDDHPIDRTLKIPVGFRIPYSGVPTAFGLREMYLEPEIIERRIDDPAFKDEWFYLEAELFGQVGRHPMDNMGPEKSQWGRRIHCGAPMATFKREEGGPWWALSGEPDYGAAIHWKPDGVLIYTTLYLTPGGSADWQATLWRQEEEEPSNVYLNATRPGGFYDQMNPLGFERKGIPEGPIVFININRPPAHLEELRKVKPKMVILNYIYDHISCVANMYGTWQTYEGFTMNEEKLKALIAELKGMGAKVGYYGTSVEQPESHKPLKPSDIVMDQWGRSFNAWEPGNWVVDAGNEDCADRLARAEAEFAQYYGLECVFVDRLDHLSVNTRPDRVGQPGNSRLENVPSVRLGVIELNKKRIEWQRKLNPTLYIGLNNTTQWAGGVRYSDFNLLEGGMDLNPPIFFLNAPHGIIHKQHYNVFFCDVDGDVVDHGIIQDEDQLQGFEVKRRAFFRDALCDGVIAQPYEDEIFVDPDSQFFKGWNNRELPDEEKWAWYDDKTFYGGDSWRKDEDTIARAIEVANRCCFPTEKVWCEPDSLPEGIRFAARRGEPGGHYIGIRNELDEPLEADFTIDGRHCTGSIEPGKVRVWFSEAPDKELETLHF